MSDRLLFDVAFDHDPQIFNRPLHPHPVKRLRPDDHHTPYNNHHRPDGGDGCDLVAAGRR